MGERLAATWPLIFAAALAAMAVGQVAFFARAEIPGGHDAELHVENTIVLAGVLRHRPVETPSFLRALPVRYPPLTYLVGAAGWLTFHSAAAFFATTIFFAATAASCLFFAARALSREAFLAALAVLAAVANPLWRQIGASFNLEIGLAATTALACWILVDARFEKSWPRAALAGLLLGICPLSKTVATATLAPMLLAYLWLAARPASFSARRLARRLAIVAPCVAVGAARHGADAWRFEKELRLDLIGFPWGRADPWWYYGPRLFGGTLILPLIACGVYLWRRPMSMRWARRNAIPLAGALGGFFFFSLIGTKNEWYLFSPFVLAVLAATPRRNATAPEKGFTPRAGLFLLFLFYAFAAALLWTPAGAAIFSWLTPAADPPPRAAEFRIGEREKTVIDFVRALTRAQGLGPFDVIAPRAAVSLAKTHTALSLVDERFTFLWAIAEQVTRNRNDVILCDTRFIVVAEPPPAAGGPPAAPVYDAESPVGLATFRIHRADYELLESQPWFDGYELHAYACRQRPADSPHEPSFDELLDVYESRRYYSHERFLRRAAADCRGGRFADADRRFAQFLRMFPQRQEAYAAYLPCLAAGQDRAVEGRRLAQLLQAGEPSPAVVAAILARLEALDLSGAAPGGFAPSAHAVVHSQPPGDRMRRTAALLYFDYRLAQGRANDAAQLAIDEIAAANPDQRPMLQAAFAAAAERRGARQVAEQVQSWRKPAAVHF